MLKRIIKSIYYGTLRTKLHPLMKWISSVEKNNQLKVQNIILYLHNGIFNSQLSYPRIVNKNYKNIFENTHRRSNNTQILLDYLRGEYQ